MTMGSMSQPAAILEHMFEKAAEARRLLESVLAVLEPEVLEGPLAERLVAEFSAIEKLGAAGKALCARRVADSGAWRRQGDRSPAHWMARATGTSLGQAAGALATAQRLQELPATDEAFRSGRLSETQANELTAAAAVSPVREPELLRAAEREGAMALRQRCRQVRAAAEADEPGRHDAIHRSRHLRHWRDPDGGFRLAGLLAPEAGALLLAALRPHQERMLA